MAGRKKIAIPPAYTQFVYDVIYKSTMQDKKRLPPKYLKVCKNSNTIRAFLKKASIEEMDELLVYMGVQWCKVYFDRGYPQKTYLREIFKDYSKATGHHASLIPNLIKDRIYATSDKEFALLLGLVSHLTNSSIYSQNLLISKAGYHFQKWKKEFDEEENKQVKENIRITKYLVSTILNAVQNYELCSTLTEHTKNDLKVLLYFYTQEHRFLKKEKIFQRFSGDLSKHKVSGCIRRLFQSQDIMKNTKEEYQIGSLGILTINGFFQSVLKANEMVD